MNTISIIGTGYVGIVTGTCLAEFGMNVICVDIDKDKIENLNKGILPIYEPGLKNLLDKNINEGRIKFTTNIKEAINESMTIFVSVGTPPKDDGSADLESVLNVAELIGNNINDYKVIVNKSTVPVGTGRRVQKIIKEIIDKRNLKIEFDIVSNPEFLREGAAVRDFTHPDRVVIGCESEKAEKIMKSIYNALYLIETPFIFTGLETAELIKYAANAFLATKISYINEISILCEEIGADVNHVAKAIGMDGRIGKHFLHAGAGFGGSCFPKDTKALIKIGQEYNIDLDIIKSVVYVNNKQKDRMVKKIINRIGNIKGKTICVLGLAFKPETDDVRESPSIYIITELIRLGAIIKTYDPIAMNNAKNNAFDNLPFKPIYCDNEYEAAEKADAIIIVTEWNQFRNLNLSRIKMIMNDRYFFDLRNIYHRNDLEDLGFIYEGVGR